jgi:hypothetical protein
METSLHRQLKAIYAGEAAQVEQRLGDYRIDAVRPGELIEIQHGSLAAIRDKIAALLAEHKVLVVKPLVARKTLVKLDREGGREVSRRQSPKTAGILDVFHELVYFTRVFPHPRLSLEVPLVEVEERRYPGHGKRRRWRADDFEVEDQRLIDVRQTYRIATCRDLVALLPRNLPAEFHTGHLASGLEIERWVAQRIAYCLRKMGAACECGKQGNAVMYRLAEETAIPVTKVRRRRGA